MMTSAERKRPRQMGGVHEGSYEMTAWVQHQDVNASRQGGALMSLAVRL